MKEQGRCGEINSTLLLFPSVYELGRARNVGAEVPWRERVK